MSLIIIGKVSLASLGAGAVAVGGFLLHKLLNPTVEIYGFVDTIANALDGSKKFECKIPNFDAFECSVKEVEKLDQYASSKNHVSLDKLTATKDVELSQEKLDKTKFYKIIIVSSVFESPKQSTPKSKPEPTPSWKSIEVFEKEDSSPSKKGNINVLSVIKNGASINPQATLGEWKTTHFVGQASKSLADISGYKCSWTKVSIAGKECTITPFVDKDADSDQKETAKISDLKFTKDSALNKGHNTKQHHYYLIKFTDSSEAKTSANFKMEDLIVAKEGAGVSESTKVEFKNIAAVSETLVGDQLLILKQKP